MNEIKFTMVHHPENNMRFFAILRGPHYVVGNQAGLPSSVFQLHTHQLKYALGAGSFTNPSIANGYYLDELVEF